MASRITLAIEVLMPERFLNKALEDGAHIFSARRPDRRTLVLELDARGAKQVRALAERFSLKCETRRIAGFQAAVDYLRARPTVTAAYGVMLLCLALFLSRIWIVDVRALGGNLPEQTAETLRRAGVRTGAAVSSVDLPLLSLELSALEGVSYASAALDGVALVIEIAGEDAAPDLYDISYARDLVAACDGVVSSVNVKSGTAMVKSGDTVRRGQVLISGEERVAAEETHAVGALGSVTARIWCEGASVGALTQSVKEYTGRASASTRISLFGLSIPLTHADSYQAWDEEKEFIPVGGLFLPLVIERTICREYIPRTVEVDRVALESALTRAAIAAAEAEMAKKAPESAEIIDKWTDFSMIDTDTLRARAVIEYTADIAVTRQYLEDN